MLKAKFGSKCISALGFMGHSSGVISGMFFGSSDMSVNQVGCTTIKAKTELDVFQQYFGDESTFFKVFCALHPYLQPNVFVAFKSCHLGARVMPAFLKMVFDKFGMEFSSMQSIACAGEARGCCLFLSKHGTIEFDCLSSLEHKQQADFRCFRYAPPSSWSLVPPPPPPKKASLSSPLPPSSPPPLPSSPPLPLPPFISTAQEISKFSEFCERLDRNQKLKIEIQQLQEQIQQLEDEICQKQSEIKKALHTS